MAALIDVEDEAEELHVVISGGDLGWGVDDEVLRKQSAIASSEEDSVVESGRGEVAGIEELV